VFVCGEDLTIHDMAAVKMAWDGYHLVNDGMADVNLARETEWKSEMAERDASRP